MVNVLAMKITLAGGETSVHCKDLPIVTKNGDTGRASLAGGGSGSKPLGWSAALVFTVAQTYLATLMHIFRLGSFMIYALSYTLLAKHINWSFLFFCLLEIDIIMSTYSISIFNLCSHLKFYGDLFFNRLQQIF